MTAEGFTAGFTAGEQRWRAQFGTLRHLVRQELVARQLANHLPDAPPRRVLDVGCGQGTQALRLARRGHRVTGLDSSATLLGDFDDALAAEPPEVRDRIRAVHADLHELTTMFEPGSFDAVLCHGVLMYFADPEPLLDGLAAMVAPGGILSLLVRNGDGMAMRPGLRRDWIATMSAFDEMAFDNRLGLRSRGDRFADLAAAMTHREVGVRAWYGVRVFTDNAPDDADIPGEHEFAELLACEERAGATDPYRQVAALTHLIGARA